MSLNDTILYKYYKNAKFLRELDAWYKSFDTNTKEFVLNWVNEDLKGFDWPKKILKSGPNKGKERLINGCYDMADAYVIGKASFSV